MEHPVTAFPGYEQADPQPWRRTAIITAAIATVELVVLVVVALAFIAKPLAEDGRSAKTKTEAQTQSASKDGTAPVSDPAPAASLARADTAVLVLNGNGVSGAASDIAKRVRALDYPVTGVGDASRKDFPRSVVMYKPELEGEGVRLARDLNLNARRAVPIDGIRPGALGDAKLVVIVGG